MIVTETPTFNKVFKFNPDRHFEGTQAPTFNKIFKFNSDRHFEGTQAPTFNKSFDSKKNKEIVIRKPVKNNGQIIKNNNQH